MMRRTSAMVLAFSLLPALLVSGEAAAQVAESVGSTATTVTTAPARTSGSICASPARRPFLPARANLARVGRNIKVYMTGLGGTPPVWAKGSLAWDRTSPRPGSSQGTVRFSAHTYPDGSALGNRMQRRLRIGARIVVKGTAGARCYRVKRKLTVSPTNLHGYYKNGGRARLGIVVCSGKRLGPGNWTKRTIWFARPSSH